MGGWATELQHYTSLELVFLVLEQAYLLQGTNTGGLPSQGDFRFEDVELDRESRDRWRWSLGPLEQYRERLEQSLARGSDRMSPTVILVKEVWNMPNGARQWVDSIVN